MKVPTRTSWSGLIPTAVTKYTGASTQTSVSPNDDAPFSRYQLVRALELPMLLRVELALRRRLRRRLQARVLCTRAVRNDRSTRLNVETHPATRTSSTS